MQDLQMEKKNTYPWIRILRCIGRSNEGRWMVICILGKEDEWTCCVNWIYFISCVIYSFILCFIGLIYINRHWWPVCLIYHKTVVILSYTAPNKRWKKTKMGAMIWLKSV